MNRKEINKDMKMMNFESPQHGLNRKSVKSFLVPFRRCSCLFVALFTLSFLSLSLLSCADDTDEYDPYENWQERNDAWFANVAATARTEIQKARSDYGDSWADHTDWRMFKSLMKSDTYQSGITADSICVRILKRGTGTTSPISTESTSIAFRGYLIPATDEYGKTVETIFTQTYYGDFDPNVAAYNTTTVSAYKDGFYTALQYMVSGDSWEVFIPYQLFYGETAQGSIPAYSAARFLIHMK